VFHESSVPVRLARRPLAAILMGGLCASMASSSALAHGFAGERFFPATLITDDPFVGDELAAPTIAVTKNPAGANPPSREIDTTFFDFSKRVTPDFGFEFAATWKHIATKGVNTTTGLADFQTTTKYVFFRDAPHETIMAAALGWQIGGSGSRRLGVDKENIYTPTFEFGKGFGDLPDSLGFLKPIAITGTLGYAIPDRGHTSHDDGGVDIHQQAVQWGLALEYSIPYLQSFVRDIGLRTPFNKIIPVVELSLSTPTEHGDRETTGTVAPGLLWVGSYYQIGAEALIPVNTHSGHYVGGIVQFHMFLDDIFPTTIGKPLFGGS
jgi:hypothetical protein